MMSCVTQVMMQMALLHPQLFGLALHSLVSNDSEVLKEVMFWKMFRKKSCFERSFENIVWKNILVQGPLDDEDLSYDHWKCKLFQMTI